MCLCPALAAPDASPLFTVNGLGCWNFPVEHLWHIDLFVDVLLLKNLDVLVKLIDLCPSDRCRIQASKSAQS